MKDPILYAVVGGPPDNWRDLLVFRDGSELHECYEVNVTEGWAIIPQRDEGGNIVVAGDEIAKVRIEGNFRIEVR